MFVVVLHDIKDASAFFGSAETAVGGSPKGVKAVQFFPSNEKDKAVCLWEAPSVQAVKSYLEGKIGTASRNTYYAVDNKIAMGLPIPAVT